MNCTCLPVFNRQWEIWGCPPISRYLDDCDFVRVKQIPPASSSARTGEFLKTPPRPLIFRFRTKAKMKTLITFSPSDCGHISLPKKKTHANRLRSHQASHGHAYQKLCRNTSKSQNQSKT